MKIKQNLFITYPDAFLRGDYNSCFSLYQLESCPDEWILCGDIELDMSDYDIVESDVSLQVIKAIDAEMTQSTIEYNKRMAMLKGRKQELLALPQPDEDDGADDDFDRWQNNEEDSRDEIARRENYLIDSQEDRQI